MRKGIYIRNVRYETSGRIRIEVSANDVSKLEEVAGNRFEIRLSGHRGYLYRIKRVLQKKSLIVGILVFTAFVFYQNLFISEVTVDGYEAISEQALRQTMREAGLYEGCRKSVDTEKIKLHLYDEYDNISWVGISFDGSLAYVTIAEGDYQYSKGSTDTAEDKPCNIVAAKEGYIEKVLPLEGTQVVEKGTYVKTGDVLISGEVPIESTAYGTEDEKKTAYYVHAAGSVTAKIPVHLDLYRLAYDSSFEPTGRRFVTVSVNGRELMRGIRNFENASAKYIKLVDIVRPFPVKIQLVSIEEVTVKRVRVTEKDVRDDVLNELHRYTEENLPEDTQILNKSLNFTREKNIIKVGVTLETLQQIGIEEEIIIDNSNGESEKNDDQ